MKHLAKFMNFTTKKHNVFYYKIRKCMPLSKNHPTQRSSELTTLQINHQQSKRNPSESRPTNTCMHKTGFHWQYFDKSRFMTKKNTKQSLQHTKTTAFFLFLSKNLDKSKYWYTKSDFKDWYLKIIKKNVNFITVFVSISTNSSNL